MNNIYYDIIDYIISFIDKFEDLYYILLIDKFYYQNYLRKYLIMYGNYVTYIKNIYPIFITKLFPNLASMRDLPRLEFLERFISPVGSIYNIKEHEVKYPIMYSVDHHDNGFLILKLKFWIKYTMISDVKINLCIIIYQNPGMFYRWCIDSDEPYYGIVFNNIINYNDIVFLKNLLNGETIKYHNCELKI
jgi:hypothetical protein